jgi:hypothetical protein
VASSSPVPPHQEDGAMIFILDLTVDLVTFSLAIGAAFFAVLVRNQFKGGMLWRPWSILGPSPLVYAFGEVMHIAGEMMGGSDFLETVHVACEAIFLMMLMLGFYLLYRAWTPGRPNRAS